MNKFEYYTKLTAKIGIVFHIYNLKVVYIFRISKDISSYATQRKEFRSDVGP